MRFTPRPRVIPERPLSEIRTAVQDRRIDRDLDRAFPLQEAEDTAPEPQDLPLRIRLNTARRFMSTTPGKLVIATFALVLMAFILGGSAINAAHNRQDDLERLIYETEPIAHASQQLYSSLSLANTAATTQFLTNSDDYSVPEQYRTAIQNASHAAIRASAVSNNLPKEDAELLTRINALLPRYTALLGEATAERDMKNPIATLHQSEAQRIMQDNLLPAAESLYLNRYNEITDAQKAWARPLTTAIMSIILFIASLISVQAWLHYLTRRRFNAGLLAATAMAVVSLLWVVVSSTITFTTAEPGSDPLSEVLTHARITSQQTRSDEMIALAQSNAGLKIDSTRFNENLVEVQEAFDRYQRHSADKESSALATEGKNALQEWQTSHATMVKLLNKGDRVQATDRATSFKKDAAGSQFTRVDGALQHAIADSRKELRDSADLAHSTMATTVAALLLLLLFQVIGIIVGMIPRFREYE